MPTKHKLYKKSIIGFTLLGLIFLGGISSLVDAGVRNSDFEQTGKVNKIVNHKINPGLIVFGSSVSEVGVDPSILQQKTGLSAYNSSMNGTRFAQYIGLIDEFNTYSNSNRYVVMVETYFSFTKVDALTFPETFLAQVDNANVYNSLYGIQRELVWKSKYVPFYKYIVVSHKYYKNAIIGWENLIRKSSNNDRLLGYAPVDRHWEVDADEAIRNTPPFVIQIDHEIVKQYVETIEQLQQKGKKVILVLTPMYTEMLKKITDISPMRNELRAIAAATGATFLDYSTSSICDNKEYFYNSNHLNLDGSKVFSARLGDSIHAIMEAPQYSVTR